MKIVKLQEGNIIKQDNTKVSTQPILKIIPASTYISEDKLIDLNGSPKEKSNSNYWHPIKGALERFKSSLKNNTNPIKGLENTVLPSLGGAALVTTPATVIGGLIGGETINNITGGFGKWLENKTGIPEEVGEYLNPGTIYGGAKGYNISKNKLASKFIKGDADLGWSPLNRDHWIFNRQSRTPTNVAFAAVNRLTPFLNNVEKTPLRIAAYNIGKRTKGNASVSIQDIKNNSSTYTGSSTPDGGGDRNLLGLYLFDNDPIVNKSRWFQHIKSQFKPANQRGFKYSERYSKLYPGIEQRRYKMSSVIKEGHPLRFSSVDELNQYSNGIGKIQGKEGDIVIETPFGFQTFRQPGTNYVGPIDDVGGHLVKIDYNNKGKLTQISQDMWKFNPADYAKRWSGNSKSEAVRANKQAALMDKVGTPFILQQENPISIGTRRIWESLENVPRTIRNRRQPSYQSGLLVMKNGNKILRCQQGTTFKDIATGMIPLVGTYQDYKKFKENPNLKNLGWLAASTIGDALFFTGAGAALKGIKAAKALSKSRSILAADRFNRSQKGLQRGLEYGASKGDVKSMFQTLRNYKLADQKYKAAQVAAQQQITKGIKNISKDLGQDAILNTIQGITQNKNGGSLTSDGRRFKFKDSPLLKRARDLSKRDMRKKFIKSDRPTYSNTKIRKGQQGLKFVEYKPVEVPQFKFNDITYQSPFNYSILTDSEPKTEQKVEQKVEPVDTSVKPKRIIKEDHKVTNIQENKHMSKGEEEFNKWYDEVEKENPEAKDYRQFLTKLAQAESGFDSYIQNKAGAPAYGYFQFMQDGKKYNNISAYAGTDIETFRNDPKLQIQAAIKLAKQFEKGFSKEDLELAAQKGYTKFGLLGGAWLAGNGGVRKYLRGLDNPSDKHWSKSGAGTSVADRISMFNI